MKNIQLAKSPATIPKGSPFHFALYRLASEDLVS